MQMRSAHIVALVVFMTILLSFSVSPTNSIGSAGTIPLDNTMSPMSAPFATSATSGVHVSLGTYIIIQYSGQSVEAHGEALLQLCKSEGIVAELHEVSELLLNPTPLDDAIAVIIDGSLGSENGSLVSSTFLSYLVQIDKPVILVGQSAWLLPILKGENSPLLTAPASHYLFTTPAFTGAVFLSMPYLISNGTLLTTESVSLPVTKIQSEKSRIVDLIGSAQSLDISPLRYDSWPLDLLLFGPEDPNMWTSSGKALFVNTISYATTLRETPTLDAISQAQSQGVLTGGFEYFHEPSLDIAYDAIRSMKAILNVSAWLTWSSSHSTLVLDLLGSLYQDLGSEAGFMNLASQGVISLKSTAQGLWIMEAFGLSSSFSKTEVVSYITSRQAPEGGFENSLTSTYYAIEALSLSGSLSGINTVNLENWLRECVVTLSDTSNPDLWGGVSFNPSSAAPMNSYAAKYVLALDYLGEIHDDPAKLTSWILSRTSNADGSFDNSILAGSEPLLGTASALLTLEMLGTLSSENRTNGLNWLLQNQLPSGGFGFDSAVSDIIGKTEETSAVALSMEILEISEGLLPVGIASYVQSIETPVGFEGMEITPSLMWSSWMSEISRWSHGGSIVDNQAVELYLSLFSSWAQYPLWNNLSAYLAREYWIDQYNAKGVWSHYFGLSALSSTGSTISGDVIGDAVSYLAQCQQISGHYKPASLGGTAHMQSSVAAIEALYLIGSLDTIQYRSALETALLSEYSSGTWDSSGWTVLPFAADKSSIDWLSTRAALRLGIIDSMMASEIGATIASRIQYDDLWALSRDVAALALLNTSYPISLEIIDRQQILDALGPAPFSDGWLNSTPLWQPIYTAGVLEMLSILGLRPALFAPDGSIINASVNPTTEEGTLADIFISISSPLAMHTVYVWAFDEWTEFKNVANTDTISLEIPGGFSVLGPHNISLMVWDRSSSRSYDRAMLVIEGVLVGSLSLETLSVFQGDQINGTATWNLESGADAGTTQVIIRLGDLSQYQQWTYYVSSPFSFSIPTDDFSSGDHNITVYLNNSLCDILELQKPVSIQAAYLTYITATEALIGTVDNYVNISWSLHFQENGTLIPGQSVGLLVEDSSHQIIHTDTLISTSLGGEFQWIPSARGNYSFRLIFQRNGTLESSSFIGSIGVFENTEIHWDVAGLYSQYDTVKFSSSISTPNGEYLANLNLHVRVLSPSMSVLYDGFLVSNSTGQISLYILLSENGNYLFNATFYGSGYLIETSTSVIVISWSSSTLSSGGIPSDGLINTTWTIWAILQDSEGAPVIGVPVSLRIVYVPSTTIIDTTLTTNTTGGCSYQWKAASPGSYQILLEYAGSSSRQSVQDSMQSFLRVPVTLSIAGSSGYEVGAGGWSLIQASNHLGAGVSGLQIMFVVRDPQGSIVFSTSGNTAGGFLNISWIPTVRGQNSISLSSQQTPIYSSALCLCYIGVYEAVIVSIQLLDDAIAPSTSAISVAVVDTTANPIEGIDVYTLVLLDGLIIIDKYNTTPSNGIVLHSTNLNSPGILSIQVSIAAQGWILACDTQRLYSVLGRTTISIDFNGLPVDQGTTVGFQAFLVDWNSTPMNGATIQYFVKISNGTIILSGTRTTGYDGTCAFAYTFNNLGDFIILVIYQGTGLNNSTSSQVVQRVLTDPVLILTLSPTALLGSQVTIQIGILDGLDQWLSGRNLRIVISVDGNTVFESLLPSTTGLSTIHWTPNQRGIAIVELSYSGDSYVLAGLIQSSISIMEQVSGVLQIQPDVLDLGNTSVFIYQITSSTSPSGIEVLFEVLDVDLVSIWSQVAFTNTSGFAVSSYTPTDVIGVLTIRVAPSEDQLLIGGETQEEIVVKTHCTLAVELEPAPASLGGNLNISIECIDDLGGPIDGLQVRVYLNYLGQPVKLGTFTNWVALTTVNGIAKIEFTPQYSGSYQVIVESSGNIAVHSFYYEAYHIVHNPTSLEFVSIVNDLEVGENLKVVVLLSNYYGDPLIGRTVTLSLGTILGPVDLITNSTGHVEWTPAVDQEGLWQISAHFDGVGVYLPATITEDVDVRYGTQIFVSRITNETLVAGVTPLAVAVLLEDTGGTPLEGRTVRYQVYHDSHGLLYQDSFVQIGQTPEILEITLDRYGNYTILFSFAGTVHYHPSSTALSVFVMGTSAISIAGDVSIDRSLNQNITIFILDELDSILTPANIILDLLRNGVSIEIGSRLVISSDKLKLSILGLQVGEYELNATLPTTVGRLGTTRVFSFNITATTKIDIIESGLNGLIGQLHSIDLMIVDSLGTSIEDAHVYISLYDPSGKEVYGNILTTRTLVIAKTGSVSVSWIPSMVGNYSLFIEFEEDAFRGYSNLSLIVLTRYETNMDITLPEGSVYPHSLRLMVTLSGGLGKVSGASLVVLLYLNSLEANSYSLVTDIRGLAQIDIVPEFAGNYTVVVSYAGNERYAASTRTLYFIIEPSPVVDISIGKSLYVGVNGSIIVAIDIQGARYDWIGTLIIQIIDPYGEVSKTVQAGVSAVSSKEVYFTPNSEGLYRILAFVEQIPIIGMTNASKDIMISVLLTSLEMDVGTFPVVSGGAVLGVIGLILRRKLKGSIDSLSVEWDS
ncbi:MAG: prenyltransferase/squalene oxidase repeat-containing protein [Candidatus Thorarchaeota archaeon]